MSSSDTAHFWEHVSDLRNTLIKIGVFVFIGMAAALFFYQEIFSVLTYPLTQQPTAALHQHEIKRQRLSNLSSTEHIFEVPQNSSATSISPHVRKTKTNEYLIPPGGYIEYDQLLQNNSLVILGPLDGMMASIKMSFWVGLVGTSPLWLFFLLAFLAPAMRPNEKKILIPFLGLSFVFLALGFSFAYFLTIPFANYYLQLFNQAIGENFWSLSNYIDYTVTLLLANALAFECCVILLFLVHLGYVTARTMRKKRRHAIVLAFVLGAILTPPDVLTQLMLALPLMALYELIIIYAKIREAKTRIKENLLYADMN